MAVSKTKIDKSGQILSQAISASEDIYIEYEDYFDQYRKEHLLPLTETTLEIQKWLGNYGKKYYIAQRLKRKPQIIRKLCRLHVRLTQLQDIGGLRIIVDRNRDVDELVLFIRQYIDNSDFISIVRITDYRTTGREDTGYRALHIILDAHGYKLELQIRSKIQHYWAEGIERVSVIYGYYLKGYEGDDSVIKYFKSLSDVFHEIEIGREPSSAQKIFLDKAREQAEETIQNSDRRNVLQGYVHEGIIKALIDKESKSNTGFNNWILIFDWNSGCFVNWFVISRDPNEAIASYVKNERDYPHTDGYEVVMVGSSDIATVKETHRHYFGVDTYENILENLDSSIVNISKRMEIDTGSRQILMCLVTKKYWNKKISLDTLKNHYCKNVLTFDVSLQTLAEKQYIILHSSRGPVSLNIAFKTQIESCL